jgi:hypothetical protein
MKLQTSNNDLVLFSRLLRWVLGAGFIGVGIYYAKVGGWPAILFGAVMFGTGFLRPRRCINENCDVHTPQN